MLLRALIAGIAAAGLAACLDPAAAPPGTPAAGGIDAARGEQADTVDDAAFELRLDVLNAPRPEHVAAVRNPFRFRDGPNEDPGGERSPAPGGQRPAPPGVSTPAANTRGPAARQPLRFIAVADAPRSAGFIAVLSDGDTVFQGRVGDTIDGRYRIMSIGYDTVEVELLPTGERQVLQRDGT